MCKAFCWKIHCSANLPSNQNGSRNLRQLRPELLAQESQGAPKVLERALLVRVQVHGMHTELAAIGRLGKTRFTFEVPILGIQRIEKKGE